MTDNPMDAADPVALPFQREHRYVIIKLKHLADDLKPELSDFLARADLPPIECVVVESDWPEHEPVWKMIEDRMTAHVERPVDAESAEYALCRTALLDECRKNIALTKELARLTAPVTDVDVAGHCQRLREIVLIDIKDQVLLNVKSADLIENLWRRLHKPMTGARAALAGRPDGER